MALDRVLHGGEAVRTHHEARQFLRSELIQTRAFMLAKPGLEVHIVQFLETKIAKLQAGIEALNYP